MRIWLTCFSILAFHFSIAQSDKVVHTLFLIGDAGEPVIGHSTLGQVLRTRIEAVGTPSTTLFLGDNVYPKGLPPEGTAGREAFENVLRIQAGWIKETSTHGIIIPGNHDWQQGGRRGLAYIQSQAAFIDSLNQGNLRFLPRDGCPGPVEIPLASNAVLVIIDTQWLLHPWEKPGEGSSCDARTTAEVLTQLEDVFSRNKHKRVIVAAHHPLITYGEHGGIASVKEHIFPLTQLRREIYLPLPVLGSIGVYYRRWIGNIQDPAHPVYREFASAIQAIMKEHPGSIYVAGHEHALEYILKDSSAFIVSGAGSKHTFVKKKKYAAFAASAKGFAELSMLENGSARVRFWQVDEQFPQGRELFRDSLVIPRRLISSPKSEAPDFSGKTVPVKGSDQYGASAFRRALMGENYRKEWSTAIEVPVFDIGSEQGGLKVVQKGGGMQTLSLRLEDKTGHEFVLRSVEKYPEHAVPEVFRKTFAQDLVQDQISAAHPYAAIVVPGLADAAGIYHTNPRLVYIPDDPRLGDYRKDFANRLALVEERPAGDWRDAAYFGNSEKIINTSKVIEKVEKDNDNAVDQEFVLKSRLFDLWIGDWDRHDDQWRWASFETKKGETYRPIPRDRDQAFFVNEGFIPNMVSRRWAMPKFEGFDESLNWPSGFSFNARYFDRTFLNEPSKDDWIKAARTLQSNLTDDAIEKSIRAWPAEIYAIHGDRIVKNLKLRREKLIDYAIAHYRFLAREVDVVGSGKAEVFTVDKKPNGDVMVTVSKVTKKREKGEQIYQRHFLQEETTEIRLFGRGGDDALLVSGDDSGITVRFIGGDGKDSVVQEGSGMSRVFFYDTKGSAFSGDVTDRTSNNATVNLYDRKAFRYNKFAPLLTASYNPDDGFFLGGGFLQVSQGFRKDPFKHRHRFVASMAPRTRSFNFRYQGKFVDVVGKWDWDIDVNVKAPNYVNNFFGLGNESVFDRDAEDRYDLDDNSINYYRFRFQDISIETGFSKQIGAYGNLRISPTLQRIEIEEPGDEPRYLHDTYAPTLPYNLYEIVNTYGGVNIHFDYEQRNDPIFTSRGMMVQANVKSVAGLSGNASGVTAGNGSIALYQSFRMPARLVFALRVGGGRNFGDYNFYQAQILDGKSELRGFRKTRFYGDSKIFTNVEMRMKLASFRSYIFPASVGIVAFQDGGRVWYSDGLGDPTSATGTSHVWHVGYGGGVWFTPFNLGVVSFEAGHSKDGWMGYARLGFLF